jgi:hypothetical protein
MPDSYRDRNFEGMSAVHQEYQRIHVGILDSKIVMYRAKLFEGKWKDRWSGISLEDENRGLFLNCQT